MPGRRRGIQLATVCALATVVHLLPMNDVQSCSVQGYVMVRCLCLGLSALCCSHYASCYTFAEPNPKEDAKRYNLIIHINITLLSVGIT